ncbi:hypothetical protein CHS0354_034268 [Potamilus streckersoni]|uniref:Coiled-coil alpha-helical rod protein 1 n=1 Tax=Potamilus streckersoni TaxID=2493646 RepID=A0AAE0S4T0_9BIVA|nr:hypothetical protein CHS0354_034268 [Potamilus streckersoni]
MAEDLNPPSHFMSTILKDQPVMDLLPPSAFQTRGTQPKDNLKEFSKAMEEIQRLQQENQRLREEKQTPVPIIVPPPVSQEPKPSSKDSDYSYHERPSRKEELKYIDELINKQAAEIHDLKNEIKQLKCAHKEEITDLERQITLKEREYIHNITSLEAELKSSESRYETQVDRLSREHQRETEEMTGKIEKLSIELTSIKRSSSSRIKELETEEKQTKENLTASINQLQQQLRSKEMELENQTKQMTQLKKYIGETESAPKPTELWRKETETMKNKLKVCEADKENLQSSVQLLNIRLTSLNEILKLQESEISQNKPHAASVEMNKDDDHPLLTRWRQKVFALMVQLKSYDITQMKEEQNWKQKVTDLERKLSTATNQIDQLSHVLSDKTAELNMERNANSRLQQELSEAQQLALCLDDRLVDNRHISQQLQTVAESVGMKFQENFDALHSMLTTMKTYGQRISFASSRVEMLQAQFARREALMKLQLEKGIEEPHNKQTVKVEEVNSEEDKSYLSSELERVTRERDILAAQIKQDSVLWDRKVKEVKSQVEEEMDNLRSKVEDLEDQIRDKSEHCCELEERLTGSQSELQEAMETIDELKTSLAKQELNLQAELEEQRRIAEAECAEKFAEMDRKLNEAKREQAKAVVSHRQLERQSAREKERAAEHLKTVEEHYVRQIEKIQEELQTVQKERNLMMATLRQEGLIGRIRSERGEPVHTDWDSQEIEPVKEQSSSTPRLTAEIDNDTATKEPLTNVLADLKALTSAVLEEGDGQSESGSTSEEET